ncbi:MAG TPA: DHA2 family efflux MFS transporter permease subunit [Chthoniobacterales bacterium]
MADEPPQNVSLRTWIGVMGTMLGAFMAVLDIQITNSSLRDITGGIAATQDEGSWVSTSYLIGEIITIPLTAWLSRVFSIRWYLLVNVGLFLVFSALCGISNSLATMVLFRAGQGFTGGVMIPMALTIALSSLPKRLQPVGLALFGMTATLGPAIGPSIGGWLTDNFGWQMDFYVNFVPGAIMIAAILYAIDPKPMQLNLLRNGDYVGIAAMAVGLGSLIAFLEEGQRQDWFTSPFIRNCAILAATFIPLFLLLEFTRKEPFVNLRLMTQRTLGLACLVNFTLGLALYGSVYLLPQYLEQVQGYSAFQTGQTMIWVGLPQLMVFPFVPMLMKRVDLRLLVCVGSLIFAFSCFLNIHMSADFAGPQFTFSNIVRAAGQPFTIIPLSQLATALLARGQQADGSALFNIARNLGGSVGTALLDTLITQREQFHDSRIGESVNVYSLAAQARIHTLVAQFTAQGFDPVRATNQAYGSLKQLVRREAYVMAYSEGFLVIGIALVAGAALVWVCQKAQPKEGGAGH